MALFSSAGTTGPFFAARNNRVFEMTAPLSPAKAYMNYACTATGWYGLAFVNENGVAGTYSAHINTGVTTGVGGVPVVTTGLKGVIPNPARGMTRIEFALERPGEVSMRVVDMAGRAVGEIAARRWGAGSWSVPWDGRSKSGTRLPAGVYFVEMLLDGQRVGRSRLALLH
jgi:hypothetical protein